MAPGFGGVISPIATIPGLHASKNTQTSSSKLLRRPLAPVKLPSLLVEKDDNGENENENKEDSTRLHSPIKMFENAFALDSLAEVESEVTTARISRDPSIFSPPPSELESFDKSRSSTYLFPQRSQPFEFNINVNRGDLKYILDPLYRENTNLGTYVKNKSLVKPFKPRGPDPLPPRVPRKNPELFTSYDADDARFYQPPAFLFEHFVHKLAENNNLAIPRVRRIVYSRHNVKKLTDMIASELTASQQERIPIIDMDPSEIPVKENRVPQRQLLYEMAAMIRHHVKDVIKTDVKSVIRPMPKYDPNYSTDPQPHTEIILYEDDTTGRESAVTKARQESEAPGVDTVLHSAHSRYFQGSSRSRSPLAPEEDGVISPTELAILDALIAGGTALSLKAHFIEDLPDIAPVSSTLTYLNLSYNNFQVFPNEVLDIENLEVLKMRNNPLTQLPVGLQNLQKLRVLVVSFCLISDIPEQLFDLARLENLNLAYNRLTYLSGQISKCRSLEVLDLEGNQISALPMKICRMTSLRRLNVRNNFMHPLFWRENAANKPQQLQDMASRVVYNDESIKSYVPLDSKLQNILALVQECDVCQGPRFGTGLRRIKPVPLLFNIKNVPILIVTCSPGCMDIFKNMKTEQLRYLLYGS